jgi:DNA-binding transcriptional regulator YiaG
MNMGTISDRIRAMHAAEPDLSHAELARRCGSSTALVNQAVGPTKPKPAPADIRHPEPPIRLMSGAEFDDCLRRAGFTRPWFARWLGISVSSIASRISGKVAVQPAEAALLRFLAAKPEDLDQVIELSAPTIPDALPLIRAYCAKPGNTEGGSLHIVLSDGNVKDRDVKLCLGRAAVLGDEDGVALARMLLRMSRTQRSKIARSSLG